MNNPMTDVEIEDILKLDTEELAKVDLTPMIETLRAARARFEEAEAAKAAKKSKKETRSIDEILGQTF